MTPRFSNYKFIYLIGGIARNFVFLDVALTSPRFQHGSFFYVLYTFYYLCNGCVNAAYVVVHILKSTSIVMELHFFQSL